MRYIWPYKYYRNKLSVHELKQFADLAHVNPNFALFVYNYLKPYPEFLEELKKVLSPQTKDLFNSKIHLENFKFRSLGVDQKRSTPPIPRIEYLAKSGYEITSVWDFYCPEKWTTV